LFFGSVGLILGLVVAYLINIPIQDVSIKIVSQIIPLFITIILAYLGFQVGFRRRAEFTELISVNRKERIKPTVEEKETTTLPETPIKGVRPKRVDTSVIIDGRIADVC